ncbi:MAG TPA: hypothetical protein VGH91_06825 [Gammaproteobacteria bacterium]|jgi:hypothetical protein
MSPVITLSLATVLLALACGLAFESRPLQKTVLAYAAMRSQIGLEQAHQEVGVSRAPRELLPH